MERLALSYYEPIDGALISLIAGYSFGDVDRKRDNSTVTGSTDSDMWYTSLEGQYSMRPSDSVPLELTARLGYLFSKKKLDAYTESDGTRVDQLTVDTSQIKPGIEASYSFYLYETALQPFVKADYVHDFVDAINGDKNAYALGGGLRILSSETGLSGEIEGERQFSRTAYSEYVIRGLIAYNLSLSGEDGRLLGSLRPFVKSNLNADGSQSIGTGVEFSNADDSIRCELDTRHCVSSDTAGTTGVNLKFEWVY